MSLLSEDPWYVVGALGLFMLGCLLAVKISQQGRYAVWAGIALVVALAWLAIERVWVTDNERIESTIIDLSRAVRRSDGDAVLALLTEDVSLTQGAVTLEGVSAREVIGSNLEKARFDFLTVSRIHADAGRQSRRGTATFTVHGSGSFGTTLGTFNFATGPSGSDWSLGLQETSDGSWKVNRITAVRLPTGFSMPMNREGRR